MTIHAVQRLIPQEFVALRVSMGNKGQVAGEVANLLAAITMIGYETESLTGPKYYGGWRLKLTYPGIPDQFGYPDDWILVTDATFSPENGWGLKFTSRAWIYNKALGLQGTASEFIEQFTTDSEFVWKETPPKITVSAVPDNKIKVDFKSPESANGPWTWQYVLKDVGSEQLSDPVSFVPEKNQFDLSTVIEGATPGNTYTVTIMVSDNYGHTRVYVESDPVNQ